MLIFQVYIYTHIFVFNGPEYDPNTDCCRVGAVPNV